MSILTPIPRDLPLYARLFYAIPFIGWIARDVAYGTEDNIYYALVIGLTLWVLSVMKFGLPGLYFPALFLVPVVMLVLILLTRG